MSYDRSTAHQPPAADVGEELMRRLRASADTGNAEGMARFGITGANMLGIPVTALRSLAAETLRGRKQDAAFRRELADLLWKSDVHEARILSSIVDDPATITRERMDAMVVTFDSWDVCDQVCMNLFRHSPLAWQAAIDWSEAETPFVKRAAFALMATLAAGAKDAADERFLPFFGIIEREASDRRNYVKKAVNWALRQIGKRSVALHAPALALAEKLARSADPAERWVGRDAQKELASAKTLERLGLGEGAGPQ